MDMEKWLAIAEGSAEPDKNEKESGTCGCNEYDCYTCHPITEEEMIAEIDELVSETDIYEETSFSITDTSDWGEGFDDMEEDVLMPQASNLAVSGERVMDVAKSAGLAMVDQGMDPDQVVIALAGQYGLDSHAQVDLYNAISGSPEVGVIETGQNDLSDLPPQPLDRGAQIAKIDYAQKMGTSNHDRKFDTGQLSVADDSTVMKAYNLVTQPKVETECMDAGSFAPTPGMDQGIEQDQHGAYREDDSDMSDLATLAGL